MQCLFPVGMLGNNNPKLILAVGHPTPYPRWFEIDKTIL